jgi:hypothetical protein
MNDYRANIDTDESTRGFTSPRKYIGSYKVRSFITMTDKEEETTTRHMDKPTKSILGSLLHDIMRDAVRLLVAFLIGSGGGLIVCLYYGFPLIMSLFGGILVMALMLALFTSQ